MTWKNLEGIKIVPKRKGFDTFSSKGEIDGWDSEGLEFTSTIQILYTNLSV